MRPSPRVRYLTFVLECGVINWVFYEITGPVYSTVFRSYQDG